MGYTNFTVSKLENIIEKYQPKTVVDLGAQNMYNQPVLPAPYAKDWYISQGIEYTAIDLSGENNSAILDLAIPFDLSQKTKFDLVVDAGTTEHVGIEGKHSPEAFYNACKNRFDLCRVGGIIYCENPKTGNWPNHGFNFVTEEFYKSLEEKCNVSVLEIGEHAAMGNITDGWNVYCIMQKNGNDFISFEEFVKLSFKTE
jgi:hypothetical protein